MIRYLLLPIQRSQDTPASANVSAAQLLLLSAMATVSRIYHLIVAQLAGLSEDCEQDIAVPRACPYHFGILVLPFVSRFVRQTGIPYTLAYPGEGLLSFLNPLVSMAQGLPTPADMAHVFGGLNLPYFTSC